MTPRQADQVQASFAKDAKPRVLFGDSASTVLRSELFGMV
jgi:hypothetical protein